MSSIIPTVGRKVWYYENAAQEEPWDATVIKVHGAPWQHHANSPVNLLAIDPNSGQSFFIEGAQASDGPIDLPHYRWMPYQQAQASKAVGQNVVGGIIGGAAQFCTDRNNTMPVCGR